MNWVDSIHNIRVMWGHTYARRRRAQDIRRAAAQASAAGASSAQEEGRAGESG